jgi:P-type Cu+ transporter
MSGDATLDTPTSQDSLATVTLPVLGMTCAACQHHVEAALKSLPGVHSAHVDLMAHLATVQFDNSLTSQQKLVDAIRDSGYDAILPRAHYGDEKSPPINKSKEKQANTHTAVALIAGFIAMIFSMPLGNDMSTVDHKLMRIIPALYALPPNPLRWSLLLITFLVVIWTGRSLYSAAWRALKHGTTNMNTLVGLGTSVALLYSGYATLFPAPERAVYFDAVLLILGFMLAGKSLEARAKRRALDALNALSHALPNTARRVSGIEKSTEVVPLEEIIVGDSILVLPGERFPVDGQIVEGRTTVDESMLTGEAIPLERTVGSRVLAGSLNYDGAVLCCAESLGETTVLSRIEKLVQDAQSSRTPLEGVADRVSAIFVPVVLGISATTFLIWFLAAHSFTLALANSVAVLVIACPCAMGLAVPAALTVAVGRGAQLGLLYKGGEALERLTTLNVILLDKTGTLTIGRPVLTSIHNFGLIDEENILRIAAAAEERSNHPLAHAIVDAARQRGLHWDPAESVQILPGRGLSAHVDEMDCLLGNNELLKEFGLQLKAADLAHLSAVEPGVTRLWIAINLTVVGCFDAKDQLRPGASAAMRSLENLGIQLRILTGDSATAAAPIARAVGIATVEAGLDPMGKLGRIRALQSEGLRVGMVGDGINDAAALAQADAGIALGSGTDLAQEAGDVILLRSDPALIGHSIELAHATLRIMRQNLIWAALYNLLGIPLAAGALYPNFHILLSPWLAAAAMAFSSISVLANSLRLRSWNPIRQG